MHMHAHKYGVPRRTHTAYFPLVKISSSTALLVLKTIFYFCQELSTYTQILCVRFVRHNLSVSQCNGQHINNISYTMGWYTYDTCIKFCIPNNNIHYLSPSNQKLKKILDKLHVAIYVPQKYYPNNSNTLSQHLFLYTISGPEISGASITKVHVSAV
jgi:hypothetical protein